MRIDETYFGGMETEDELEDVDVLDEEIPDAHRFIIYADHSLPDAENEQRTDIEQVTQRIKSVLEQLGTLRFSTPCAVTTQKSAANDYIKFDEKLSNYQTPMMNTRSRYCLIRFYATGVARTLQRALLTIKAIYDICIRFNIDSGTNNIYIVLMDDETGRFNYSYYWKYINIDVINALKDVSDSYYSKNLWNISGIVRLFMGEKISVKNFEQIIGTDNY